MATTVAEEEVRGRRCAAKRASSAGDRPRLRAEAALLAAVRHPGLVELVEVVDRGEGADGPTGPTLVTAWVAGGSLAAALPLPDDELAGVVAAVATTLGDLHGLGWVHGALDATHVLLHDDGRPVLCGLGHGGRRGDPGGDGSPLDPTTDVDALGRLLADALGDGPVSVPATRAALEQLAAVACDPVPSARPSARAIAAAIAEGVGAPRLPGAAPPRAAPSPLGGARDAAGALADLRAAAARRQRQRSRRLPWPRVDWTSAIGAVALLGGGAAVLVALAGPARPRHAGGAGVVASTTTLPTVVSTTVVCTAGGAGGRGGRASRAGVKVDVDGCPDDVRVEGTVLVVGDRRYAVGLPGDRVLVGDWDCDGRATAAVLRVATGEVYRFDRLPVPGEELSAVLAATVPGAVDVEVTRVGGGCDAVVVRRGTAAGEVVTLDVAARGSGT